MAVITGGTVGTIDVAEGCTIGVIVGAAAPANVIGMLVMAATAPAVFTVKATI